ncbi:uncharacterized protein [Nicotiana tomentosiformis]|uniref:uncharacterized protein n=1 Tax=Nicotiana tomentosiformis TaxID=4098 RepID=UPI00388C63C4
MLQSQPAAGGLGSSFADGMAFCSGNAVGHRAVDAVLGPRVIRYDVTDPASSAVATSNSIDVGACGAPMKAFQEGSFGCNLGRKSANWSEIGTKTQKVRFEGLAVAQFTAAKISERQGQRPTLPWTLKTGKCPFSTRTRLFRLLDAPNSYKSQLKPIFEGGDVI